jgi:hypothetical protein
VGYLRQAHSQTCQFEWPQKLLPGAAVVWILAALVLSPEVGYGWWRGHVSLSGLKSQKWLSFQTRPIPPGWALTTRESFRVYSHFSCNSQLTQSLVQWVPGVLFPGVKRGRGVTLTTHPIYSRGREWVGAILPFPLSASMACSWTALLLLNAV